MKLVFVCTKHLHKHLVVILRPFKKYLKIFFCKTNSGHQQRFLYKLYFFKLHFCLHNWADLSQLQSLVTPKNSRVILRFIFC